MGYHRLHTHRGYKTTKLFEYFLAVCGTLTLEGGPIFWVAVHRQHHQHSDQPLDPHTPHVSGFWSHMGWILFGEAHHNDTTLMSRYAPDLARDPFYRWLTTYHWVPLTVLGFALLAVGGWPLVNWAIFLRVVMGLHATWLVNSATHMWGRRRFSTRDDSKNTWWVALLTFGEGWHNNHHAHPVSARHGLAWYEFDSTWIELKLLKALGLVWDVQAATTSQLPKEEIAASETFYAVRYDIGGRRKSIAFFIVLGACLTAAALALNVSWVIVNWRAAGMLVLGFLAFPLIITGVVLNTIFLVREIRRNEQHDAFINAVTHELKTPVASIRLYLQTLQSREIDDSKRQEFYRVMVEDTDRPRARSNRCCARAAWAGSSSEPVASRPVCHRAGLSRRAHRHHLRPTR
jgi:stearoyl-CoA desaturase (delta-9 desaturase)